MAYNRQLKRERGGGAYCDLVPLDDNFSLVYVRDGKLRRIGKPKQTVTDQPKRVVQQDDLQWDTAPSWHVQDDPEYALDANGAWYDETVTGNVMENSADLDASKSKKSHSRVLVCQYLLLELWSLTPCRNVHMLFGRNSIVKIIWMRSFNGRDAPIFAV